MCLKSYISLHNFVWSIVNKKLCTSESEVSSDLIISNEHNVAEQNAL